MGFLDFSPLKMMTDMASVFKEQMEGQSRANERIAKTKPGEYCIKDCDPDAGMCTECLLRQKEFADGLKQLEALERGDLSQMPKKKKKAAKCALCGALRDMTRDDSECPFCATSYVDEEVEDTAPASPELYEANLLRVAEDTYAHYVWVFEHAFDVVTTVDEGYQKKLPGFGNLFGAQMPDLHTMVEEIKARRKMDGMQIRRGAEHYNTRMHNYLLRIAKETADPLLEMEYKKEQHQIQEQLEQKNEIRRQRNLANIERSMQESREIQQRQRQVMIDRDEKLRQIRNEQAQREQRLAQSRVPHYIGGPQDLGYCCGNCVHYMTHDNKCAYSEFRHPTGASDYCNNHRSR